MKIHLAKSAGFCFGVKRALEIALKAAKSNPNIEMLGDIVHNENVVKDITKTGIRKIKQLNKGENKSLLIRAHGASIQTFEKARASGYTIIDATCPMVKEIHKIAKDYEKQGFSIIVIGDKKHDETRGILGQLKKKAIVIDCIENIPVKKIRKMNKAAVVVQSTQNLDKTLQIADILKENIKEFKFFNTICSPTRKKQKEIKTMPLNNDIMIIIGSKTSANTKRLYQISKAINKNSFWIQTEDEINPLWFKEAKSVGITAGASTPDSTTKNIIQHIEKISLKNKA